MSPEGVSYLRGSRGKPICKTEHSEMLSPAFLEPKNQFPRQRWISLKFPLKLKFSMKLDSW